MMAKKTGKQKDKTETKTKELENQLKRALADYQNLQKRVEKEKAGIIKFANEVLLLKILGIVDGLEMVLEQFQKLLESEGFDAVEVKEGDKFDPQVHEAVGTEGEGEEIVEVMSKAYKLHDKIIRPARVRVGRVKKEE